MLILEFAQYLGECLLVGWRANSLWLGLTDTLILLCSIAVYWNIKSVKSRLPRKWEDKTKDKAKYLFPILFLICWLVVAPFILHRENQQKILSFEGQAYRPYLSVRSVSFGLGRSFPENTTIEMELVNASSNIASETKARLIEITQDFVINPNFWVKHAQSELMPNEKWHFIMAELTRWENPPLYFYYVFEISTKNAHTGKKYSQTNFWKWERTGSTGNVSIDEGVSEEEKQKIVMYLEQIARDHKTVQPF